MIIKKTGELQSFPRDSNTELWEIEKYSNDYSAVRKTTFCKHCNAKVVDIFKAEELKNICEGLISSDELSFYISDQDIFLHIFAICVVCNDGFDIEGIEIKPSKEEISNEDV